MAERSSKDTKRQSAGKAAVTKKSDAKGSKGAGAKKEAEPESTITKNPAPGPRTLAIDIGGTGLKAKVLDAKGQALTERVRVETPRPATPKSVLDAIWGIVDPLGNYDRVSVGFPGVVVEGVTRTAPNLDPAWKDFPLARTIEKHTQKPTRVLNDAGVQGHGVVSGKGVEMVLTLGTGMGCALFVNGHYVPNLELAHHPFANDKTYEEFFSDRALKRVGEKKWSRRVARVLAQIQPIFNPQRIYLGGGNARKLTEKLPANVTVVDNAAGLFGGIALWRDNGPAAPAAKAPAEKPAEDTAAEPEEKPDEKPDEKPATAPKATAAKRAKPADAKPATVVERHAPAAKAAATKRATTTTKSPDAKRAALSRGPHDDSEE